MNKATKDKMEGLVSARALFELHQATKVMFRDLAFGDETDGFELDDIRAFLTTKVFSAVVEAAEDGPPKPENEPTLTCAINYVRRYVIEHGYDREVAERQAITLYDLSDIGIRMLKTALPGVGVK